MKLRVALGLVAGSLGLLAWWLSNHARSSQSVGASHESSLHFSAGQTPAAAGLRALTGRVTTERGAPAAGVALVLTSRRDPGELAQCEECGASAFQCPEPRTARELVAAIRASQLAAPILARAVSDEAGRFRFESVAKLELQLVARMAGSVAVDDTGTGVIVVGPSNRAEGIACGGYVLVASQIGAEPKTRWFEAVGPETHVVFSQ